MVSSVRKLVGVRKELNNNRDFIKWCFTFWNPFFYIMVLNITTELVKQYACGLTKQQRRDRMAVLCFAIWCKMQHSNSVIFNMSVRKMKSLLGIGQARAEHLHKAIENDDLFEVLPNGRFKVSSFKDDTIKMSKKGRRFKGANTFIIEVNKDYKLRDIYNRLNELLFLRPIGSNEANSSHVSVNKNKKSLCRSSYITNKEFQGAVGLGRSSVSNIKKRLLSKGEIKSTYAQLHVADKRNKESVNTMLRNLGLRKPRYTNNNLQIYVVNTLL